jgi:hypothetical protein
MRTGITALILSAFLLVGDCIAQANRNWVEASRKDAEKMLNDSSWGKTQTDTDVSELFYSPTKPGTSAAGRSATVAPPSAQQEINNNRSDQGATNQAVSVRYHVKFLSAKPVREAIARLDMPDDEASVASYINLMQPFVDRDFGIYVVISVTFDSTDGRYSGPAIQAFGSATAETLRNKTYLERKDGKRVYLTDYRAPQSDGLGAKFVFLRGDEGVSLLNPHSGSVRFYSEVGDKIKLNVTFKVADLMYNGKLEY